MKNDFIIHKPERQDRGHRLLQGVLTAGFWLLFLSLLRPVLALVAWLVGLQIFTHEMIDKNGGRALLEALWDYGLVLLTIALVMRTWAWYNRRRFAGMDRRRKPVEPMSLETIARYHQVDPRALALWQQDRWLYVRHNAAGRVLEVQANNPPSQSQECLCVALTQHPLHPKGGKRDADRRFTQPPPC